MIRTFRETQNAIEDHKQFKSDSNSLRAEREKLEEEKKLALAKQETLDKDRERVVARLKERGNDELASLLVKWPNILSFTPNNFSASNAPNHSLTSNFSPLQTQPVNATNPSHIGTKEDETDHSDEEYFDALDAPCSKDTTH